MDDVAPAQTAPETPPASPAAPKVSPPSAPPPAAQKVVSTPVAESDAGEMVELRRKVSEAERAKKAAEMRAAELEDENTRLRTPTSSPAAPRRQSAPLTIYEAFCDREEGAGEV